MCVCVCECVCQREDWRERESMFVHVDGMYLNIHFPFHRCVYSVATTVKVRAFTHHII